MIIKISRNSSTSFMFALPYLLVYNIFKSRVLAAHRVLSSCWLVSGEKFDKGESLDDNQVYIFRSRCDCVHVVETERTRYLVDPRLDDWRPLGWKSPDRLVLKGPNLYILAQMSGEDTRLIYFYSTNWPVLMSIVLSSPNDTPGSVPFFMRPTFVRIGSYRKPLHVMLSPSIKLWSIHIFLGTSADCTFLPLKSNDKRTWTGQFSRKS